MYKLPDSLRQELDDFAVQTEQFLRGDIEPVKFKAIRVPMGIYEQRENGRFMCRIRCAAGMLTPAQLRETVRIAMEENTFPIHLTTRQEVQLHNLTLDNINRIADRLYGLGLTSRGGGGNTVRNIVASDDAGIAPDEVFDVTPYAIALTNRLIAEPDSWTLPRKYKIALSGNDADNAAALFNDLGLVATLRNGEKGFRVYIGGGLGSSPSAGWEYSDFVPASDVLYVAAAVKKIFSENGNRRNKHQARLRYVFYKLGQDEVFRLFREAFDALKRQGGYELDLSTVEYSPAVSISAAVDGAAINDVGFRKWRQRYVRRQRQDGVFAVEIPVEHGVASPELLLDLASFLEPLGNDTFRFTVSQNILLRNIPEAALYDLYLMLIAIHPDVDRPRILLAPVACAGADTCRLGICRARGASAALKKALRQLPADTLDSLSDLRINFSGCPNSCGRHQSANLGFCGKAARNSRLYPAYYVFAGGNGGVGTAKMGERHGEISARDLPVFTVALLQSWLDNRAKYPDFNDFVSQNPDEITRLQGLFPVPSFDDDKNYYFDWTGQELFSLSGKGQAECSAGMFDMIDFDRDSFLAIRKGLDASADEAKLLADMVFHASRMLLVTRGIEPKNRNDVFGSFIEAFIGEGYVDGKFEAVVSRVRQGVSLAGSRALVEELGDAVIALYDSMDDSLQFTGIAKKVPVAEATATEATSPAAHTRFKDLRGVICPMNFVKTKLELATMQSGDTLEIFLDDGQPIQNVPGSVRNEGHTVLEESRVGPHWRVVIRKA
ncbi:MAG: sulfurtransferase TusA family protein [Bacteroidales bacterium]|nr:sulfurtransferase TusA family protein [Bacteroidales bacterium]